MVQRYLPLIFLSLFLSTGCDWIDSARSLRHGQEQEAAVVRVGSTVYLKTDLDLFMERRLPELQELENADQVKSTLLESFVEEKLWLHEAERYDVEVDPRVLEAMLEDIEPIGEITTSTTSDRDETIETALLESLKIQRYLKEYVLKDVSVSEKECRELYTQNNEKYISKEVVHVREILVEDQEEAEKIQASLKENRNKNFAELARTYSKAPSASLGGDLGRHEKGDLPKDFEDVIFRLSPGTVSNVVTSEYGCHIFFVEEKILAHHQKFYEVEDLIREELRSERERVIIEDGTSLLMKQLPVEIYPEGLDFNYTGDLLSSRIGKTQ